MLKRCSTCKNWARFETNDPDRRVRIGRCGLVQLSTTEGAFCPRWKPRACYEKLAKSEGNRGPT